MLKRVLLVTVLVIFFSPYGLESSEISGVNYGEAGVLIPGVPFYSQNDPKWACDLLGDCSLTTLGLCPKKSKKGSGCLVASLAMIYSALSDHDTNPGELNRVFVQSGEYVSGCNIQLSKVQPDETPIGAPWEVAYKGHRSGLPEKMVDEEILSGNPVLAKVTFQRKGKQWPHFVVIVGKNALGEYLIADPWSQEEELLTLNNGALGAYVVNYVRFYARR